MALNFKSKPCAYTGISQPYKRNHKGIDLVNHKLYQKTPITAVADGTIVCAGGKGHNWDWSYGNEVAIYHGGGNYTNYAHLSKIYVKVGQKVKAGAKIGLMGSTGRSTGTHLHFEVHKGRKWNRVNPKPYIDKVGASTYSYTIGKNYTLQDDMNIRTSHSATAKKVSQNQLTACARAKLTADGQLKKGTVVSCKSVWTGNGETWIKIPSGWICAKNGKGKAYVK